MPDGRVSEGVHGGEAGARAAAPVVGLRLFASAREAAGTARAELAATTVGEAIERAGERYGVGFAEVAGRSRIWVNGEPATSATALHSGDEVAVLPPVSGGSEL